MEFSPRHRKGCRKGKCWVSGCDSKMTKNRNLSFHKVPPPGSSTILRINAFGNSELVDRRTEWLKKLNIKESDRYLLVCSLHFEDSDYKSPEHHAQSRILKKKAVPKAINSCKENEASKLQRQQRCKQRQLKKNIEEEHKKNASIKLNLDENEIMNVDESLDNILIYSIKKENACLLNMDGNASTAEPDKHDPDCEYSMDNSEVVVTSDNHEFSFDTASDDIENNSANRSEDRSLQVLKTDVPVATEAKGVQVNSGDFIRSFSSFIKNEKDLITICNIKSFAILDKLTHLTDKAYPPKRKRLLSTRDAIMLTTAKLKLDISFSALAVFFNQVSSVTVRNIFYDCLKKLSTILQSTIQRVSKEEIQRNMPKCFDNFKTTTSVLDCTEIKIQQPKCLKCRIKFYSHYKGSMTVKFMTEVTPAGIIVCVSESFGGRASDKNIFNHTGVLQHLESTRDSIMVDKGFLIDEECMEKRIQLIRPPFMRNQQRLSEEDALKNRQIACARVHIERMNQRIKQFQILNNMLPWSLVHYIDDIFMICCGLANLGTPILADDKF